MAKLTGIKTSQDAGKVSDLVEAKLKELEEYGISFTRGGGTFDPGADTLRVTYTFTVTGTEVPGWFNPMYPDLNYRLEELKVVEARHPELMQYVGQLVRLDLAGTGYAEDHKTYIFMGLIGRPRSVVIRMMDTSTQKEVTYKGTVLQYMRGV